MKKSNQKAAVYERMIRNVLLKESTNSEALEENVKSLLRKLFGEKSVKEGTGGYTPYDIAIEINKETFHLEVKEQKGQYLAKLGSAKVGEVMADSYISSLKETASSITRSFFTDPSSKKFMKTPLGPLLEWWEGYASSDSKLRRFDAISRLEISKNLFDEVTTGSGVKGGLADNIEKMLQILTGSPGKDASVIVSGERIDPNDEMYSRILSLIASKKNADLNVPGVTRLVNSLLDTKAELKIAANNWQSYKKNLAEFAASTSDVRGIFGVTSGGKITFYSPSTLTVSHMTQGGRLILIPDPPGSGLQMSDTMSEGDKDEFLRQIGATFSHEIPVRYGRYKQIKTESREKILHKMIKEVLDSRRDQ